MSPAGPVVPARFLFDFALEIERSTVQYSRRTPQYRSVPFFFFFFSFSIITHLIHSAVTRALLCPSWN